MSAPDVKAMATAAYVLYALREVECPKCDHKLYLHADKYGCNADLGDTVGGEDGPAQCRGNCGCKGGEVPWVKVAIEAIRRAH